MTKTAEIPTYPTTVLSHFVYTAQAVFESHLGEGGADINTMNAEAAAAIWEEIRKYKEMRSALTRNDALNIAYRLTSMLILIQELDEANITGVQLNPNLCKIVANMPLRPGDSYDMDDFLERWHYNEKNQGH